MKRLSFIMMALAMVMAFTQCKKDNQNPTENNAPVLEGEEVHITLTLNSGSSDTRADVIPDDTQGIAPVKFKARNGNVPGDIIWVAYDGKNVGALECTSLSSSTDQNSNALGVFTGTITISKNGNKPLYFYFLGNKTPDYVNQTINNVVVTTGYTVDLSDQSGELPVISYAMSEQNYPSDNNQYTVKYNWLKNQCALVKFTMENIYNNDDNVIDDNDYAIYTTTKPITIYGMKNQVTINLANPATSADQLWGTSPDWNHTLDASFTWSKKDGDNGDNTILLWSPSTTEEVVRYAIVAPGTYTTTTGKLDVPFDASNDDYGFFGTYKLNGSVANNAYYKDAKIDLVWHSGAFSISETEKVVFSRGNLQYANLANTSGTRSAATWRFAKHQYDWVGGVYQSNRNGNVAFDEGATVTTLTNNDDYSDNNDISASGYKGWIDLFGYGTGNAPMKYSASNSDYNDYHEWGQHNIVNSGKPDATDWWRTMTHSEWRYVKDTRTNAHTKLGAARINSKNGYVNGLVLLPDNWRGGDITSLTWSSTGSGTDLTWTCNGNFTDNSYSSEEVWKTTMEQYGAVFLPAAGYRHGLFSTDFFDAGTTGTSQNRGSYHSSTMSTGAAVWSLTFEDLTTSNVFSFDENTALDPDNGRSVRLVHKLPTTTSKFFNKKD